MLALFGSIQLFVNYPGFDVAMRLQPHEAWRVLADIIHGERVINTAPRRPVVGALDQPPLDFLKDWLGVKTSDGNIYCEGE